MKKIKFIQYSLKGIRKQYNRGLEKQYKHLLRNRKLVLRKLLLFLIKNPETVLILAKIYLYHFHNINVLF
jgi:hypothetical protein